MRDNTKPCATCGIEKALSEFYTKGDRYDNLCKLCRKEKARADYRFKLSPRDKARLARLSELLLDFHIKRQKLLIEDINALIAVGEARRQSGQGQQGNGRSVQPHLQ